MICLVILTLGMVCCSPENEIEKNEFIFIKTYKTSVTVGGIVGIAERTFEVGEIYPGTEKMNGNITIRIANHSKLNEDCPNSWCYQEYLDVPQDFLKLTN